MNINLLEVGGRYTLKVAGTDFGSAIYYGEVADQERRLALFLSRDHTERLVMSGFKLRGVSIENRTLTFSERPIRQSSLSSDSLVYLLLDKNLKEAGIK